VTAPANASPDGRLQESRPHERVLVWTLGGEELATSYGTNAVALLGDDGVVLVDPLVAPAHARLVERALRRHTDTPVRLVVLTHHHTDHALGASWFAARGIPVLAHAACAERIAAEHPGLIAARRAVPALAGLFDDAEPVRPTVTFSTGVTLHLDGLEVEVWHPGWGHTPGDAFLYLPGQGVALTGDLVFHRYHFNYEDASPDGVRRGLEALRALDAEIFVPGHGPPGGPELLTLQAHYHETVEAVVREAFARGEEEAAIVTTLRQTFPDHALALVLPTAVAWVRRLAAPASASPA